MRPPQFSRMSSDQALEALRAIYREVDALLAGYTCDTSGECCHFGTAGREPYPSAVELAELERAIRARGGVPRRTAKSEQKKKRLPLARSPGTCVLLSKEGKCLVYASRPFGCRTFFCERGKGPAGEDIASALPREELARMGRSIAALSEQFAPRDPGPRPLSRAMTAWQPRS